MRGDVNQQMTDGIDDSACVVVFVTSRYISKAGGKGPNGEDDNCKFEVTQWISNRTDDSVLRI